ncbi:AAA family ATPase [Actinacidiphila acidipaludis]|uniref:AAA family ATPase n=1 Tax=Actinacidiphila acidipaludis TaxID=2873382 RepID=A0ABS7QD72_9ACTN|nr:AAA family ATPase [Streptomyces acidipaludis]MBY8879719.1 AAA family ATPase [Streptomyces acidipaludis]
MLGRQKECRAVADLLDVVRAGHGGALVVRGEAGIGKTALLDHAARQAPGTRVARVSGVESEEELAWSGLRRLCTPLLAGGRPPGPRHDALGAALGLTAGPPPGSHAVGLAVRDLLTEAGVRVCLIDDAPWIDSASLRALTVVAGQARAGPVALLFAARDGEHALDGLPGLRLRGLAAGDAERLLDAASATTPHRRARRRILHQARGNPLALLELARDVPLADGPDAPVLHTPAARIERLYARRLAELPADSRLLTLVAAAEARDDPKLVWDAAGALGVEPEAAVAAASAGLLELAEHVAFRHPLVRSAVHRVSPYAQRRAAHRALAGATDPEHDPERRAWHLADATVGLDDRLATELQKCADRAESHGGTAGAAALRTRSARLTVDPARRARRLLAAGETTMRAGGLDAALDLAHAAEGGPLSPADRTRTALLRARIASARAAAGPAQDPLSGTAAG